MILILDFVIDPKDPLKLQKELNEAEIDALEFLLVQSLINKLELTDFLSIIHDLLKDHFGEIFADIFVERLYQLTEILPLYNKYGTLKYPNIKLKDGMIIFEGIRDGFRRPLQVRKV